MSFNVAYSTKESVPDVINEVTKQAGSIDGKLVIFFASSRYNLEEIGQSLQREYPDADVIGCTTAGEIVSGHVLKNSVVVGIMDGDTVEDVSVSVIEQIKERDMVEISLESIERHYGHKLSELDMEKYVGIILFDGLSGAEEKIMDKLGNLTDLIFVGGSAGDDLAFKKTQIFARGKARDDVAVAAVLKTRNGYEIIKTQSFKQLDRVLMADEVEEVSRKVCKFNGVSASQAYAEATGVPVAEIADKFMSNPLGLIINDEPFVRSPQQVTESGDMIFYCNIMQGMELSLLESQNIVDDTKKELARVNGSAGIINFNCILRTLELEAKNQTGDYGKLFSNTPTVGFSTYGEAYLGHINQTATMLVLK